MAEPLQRCAAPPRLLVVDDEQGILDVLVAILSGPGYVVESSRGGADALARAGSGRFDLLILDLVMPEVDGIAVLRAARSADPDVPVVMLSGLATVEKAVEAMKVGAEEFLLKPAQPEALLLIVRRLLEYHRLRQENVALRERLNALGGNEEMVGKSKPMRDVLTLAARVAPLAATVLVEGESGTGKELLARSLHAGSPGSGGPFVGINCAVIPVTLLESELFGYERGAFTGAERRKIGYFEAARGGTLFLDEIGEMPLELQVKLLRVLQEKRFQRLGGTAEIPCEARVIASTNRDLEQEVAAGRFRKDLFYRINVVTIRLPALRDRPDDIPDLAYHFLRRFARELDRNVNGINPAVMEAFLRARWDGNIRELQNVVERAVAVTDAEEIRLRDLPASFGGAPTPGCVDADPSITPFAQAKVQFEQGYLRALLRAADGNVSRAARLAGMARTKLHEKLRKHGMRDTGPSQGT